VRVADPQLAAFVGRYHGALDAFFAGDPAPAKGLYSHRDDVSLANPFGPVVVGWSRVEETMERAARNYREGRAMGFETLAAGATPGLAYLVEMERFEAKIGERDELASGALRVTSILRAEDGEWKILHRHADTVTSPRPPHP
jgi:ketosteroid isomerase-like protein